MCADLVTCSMVTLMNVYELIILIVIIFAIACNCCYLKYMHVYVWCVFFLVCAVRVIAESDIMQDFLASEDNVVSISKCFVSVYYLYDI